MYNLPTSRTATCSPSHNPSAACAVHRECPGSTETPSTLQTACACLRQQPPLSKPPLKSQSRRKVRAVLRVRDEILDRELQRCVGLATLAHQGVGRALRLVPVRRCGQTRAHQHHQQDSRLRHSHHDPVRRVGRLRRGTHDREEHAEDGAEDTGDQVGSPRCRDCVHVSGQRLELRKARSALDRLGSEPRTRKRGDVVPQNLQKTMQP